MTAEPLPTVHGPDDLYGLDPEGFVAARNALAKQLRAAGQKADAAAIAKLRRPPITAWALNQVARHDTALVDEVVRCGEGLRLAMDAALGGDASGVREAQQRERVAVDAVLDAAARHLDAHGHAAADAARRRIAQTVRAALVDEDARTRLQRGVLENDVDASGLGMGDLTGFTFAPPAVSGDEDTAAPADASREAAATEHHGAGAAPPRDDATDQKEPAPRPGPEAVVPPVPAPDPALVEQIDATVARRDEHQAAAVAARDRVAERRIELERAQRLVAQAETALAQAEAVAVEADRVAQADEAAVVAAQQALAEHLAR